MRLSGSVSPLSSVSHLSVCVGFRYTSIERDPLLRVSLRRISFY
jgi:hypothetical protein